MTRSPSTTPPPSPRTPAPARSTCSPTTPTSTAARRRSPRSTQPANGTVAITGDGQALTYTPDPNYCNEGGPTDNFTYTLNGGSTATVTVTVTCADDDPVAVDDAATVAEDSGATAINVLANDTDVDGGPKTITAVDPARQRRASPSPATARALTYTPDPNYCNEGGPTDNFTYTLNGGSTATVSVTVTCADDDPVAVDDAATVAEDSGASAINVLANDTDVDGGPKTITAVDPARQRRGRRRRRRPERSPTRPTPTTATRAARPTTSPTP